MLFRSPNEKKNIPLTRLALITSFAVYIQLIIGAVMRHNNAGLAVPDFPLAYGQLFPSLSPEAIDQYNQQLIQFDFRIAADDAVMKSQIVIHMLHRGWALVTAFFVVWTAIRMIKLSQHSRRFARLGYALFGLIALQITLGAFTIVTRKAVDITTLHVATGALLLVMCTVALFHAIKLYGFRTQHRTAVSFSTRGVTA